MSSTNPQIAMTIRSEPGWRAVLRKPLQRPPQPEDVPGELLYKLVIQPIRFWGFTLPVYSEYLRRKPVPPAVPAPVSDSADALSKMFEAGILSNETMISSVSHMQPNDVVQPIPLGKGRKAFSHLVDVVSPDETDEQALSRIEAVYENERMTKRLRAVLFVMES
jgi:hypothetical protein